MARSLPAVAEELTPRRVATGLALLAAVAVLFLAVDLFPYHTSNHDEAVYLQQAAMLLEGKLALQPPLVEPFHPWFFVVDGSTMYPKYSPVPAAIFATGMLVGVPRLALAAVAAAVVALTYAVVAEAFDGPTGAVAAGLVLLSPLFLIEASVFLPYVPTLALNLLFAWAYLRADRTGSRRFAGLAGLAIAVAFFARPYTAVLFAAPFVVHALWTLRSLDRPVVVRQGITAALGLCGVGVALGYNALVTGSALTFPYEAFAPLDGPGFGRREILGYERMYTIDLALEAHARALWQYVTEWSVAAPLGALVAAGGLAAALARARDGVDSHRLILAGLVVSVPLGQLYFWGTLNILGNLADPTDGLISFLGPYYHASLLLPTAAFGGYALVTGWRHLRGWMRDLDDPPTRRLAVAAVVLVAASVASPTAAAIADPIADNREVTREYEAAYEPFKGRSFENALVFLPTPYGEWLNHPFQALRNDPGYDGDTVYALDVDRFAVVDAFPDRQLYRYTFRGEWLPYAGEPVTPRLQRIGVASGEEVRLSISAGVPQFARSVSVRVEGRNPGYATAASPGDRLNLTVDVRQGQAVVDSPAFDDPVAVALEGDEPLDLRLFVDYGTLNSFSYDVTVPVESGNGTVRVLTPLTEVCRSPRLCGGEAAYVPGTHRPGVSLNVSMHE